MESYLEKCKELSLTAREAIALHCFEKYCEKRQLKCRLIDEAIEYLWRWPLIDGPDEFDPWESNKTALINYGFGKSIPTELGKVLKDREVDEEEFKRILKALIGILWANFWGASDDEFSLNLLKTVIELTSLEKLPKIDIYQVSKFCDMHGWGNKISRNDYERWRSTW
jgi:hypothetical protein